MGANSHIEWTDHTFNPWIGCTKVSPGCVNCYAEARDLRFAGGAHWGKGAPRKRTSAANWKEPLKWNRIADENEAFHDSEAPLHDEGDFPPYQRPRVFCASLADWLDDEVPIEWLKDLLCLVAATPHLDWLLLTKRPQNFRARIAAVAEGWSSSCELAVWWTRGVEPRNVWVGTTIEDQTRADERIPLLLSIPARVRFLSCEPLLGPVDLSHYKFLALSSHYRQMRASDGTYEGQPWVFEGFRPVDNPFCPRNVGIHWVICGGESGPNARPMNPAWARSLRDQCQAAEVAFLFKQWGEFMPAEPIRDAAGQAVGYRVPIEAKKTWRGFDVPMAKVGKHVAGRLLDGRTHDEFPTASQT